VRIVLSNNNVVTLYLRLLQRGMQRKWQRVLDIISADGETVYETNGRHHRLGIHELCRMVALPTAVRSSRDEMSDDEDNEDPDAPATATCPEDHDHHDPGAAAAVATEETFSGAYQQCEDDVNAMISEVAKVMIDVSHSLGPISVVRAPADVDDATNQVALHDVEEDGARPDDDSQRHPEHGSGDGSDSPSALQFHESVLTVPDSLGKTPLHILCESSCDMNMMRVILGSTRENTGNPCSPTAMSLITAKDSAGCSPLHYLAYSRQCPFSSLQLLMDYCKPCYAQAVGGVELLLDPTLCTDSDGDTPLHWALEGYMSPRRIRELLRHSKDAMAVRNHAGQLPFDQFAANFIDDDWKVHEVCGREVWENIDAYLRVVCDDDVPGFVDDGDDTGSPFGEEKKAPAWLPLHVIAGFESEFPPIFTDIALHYCKDDLSKVDAAGRLPLHLACQRKEVDANCAGSLAQRILAEYPQAAYRAVTSTNRLPIHLAVASQKLMSLVTALIKTYPRSLNIPDPLTGLWLYVLAGVDNVESVEMSFILLRADPSILQLAVQVELSKRGQRASEGQEVMDAAVAFQRGRRTVRRLDLQNLSIT
jgi:Ankyrin repeat